MPWLVFYPKARTERAAERAPWFDTQQMLANNPFEMSHRQTHASEQRTEVASVANCLGRHRIYDCGRELHTQHVGMLWCGWVLHAGLRSKRNQSKNTHKARRTALPLQNAQGRTTCNSIKPMMRNCRPHDSKRSLKWAHGSVATDRWTLLGGTQLSDGPLVSVGIPLRTRAQLYYFRAQSKSAL